MGRAMSRELKRKRRSYINSRQSRLQAKECHRVNRDIRDQEGADSHVCIHLTTGFQKWNRSLENGKGKQMQLQLASEVFSRRSVGEADSTAETGCLSSTTEHPDVSH